MLYQSINQVIKRSISQSLTQSINLPAYLRIYLPTYLSLNGQLCPSICLYTANKYQSLLVSWFLSILHIHPLSIHPSTSVSSIGLACLMLLCHPNLPICLLPARQVGRQIEK